MTLQRQASSYERCDLYENATQTVFGEGPLKAKVVLVGEQPGDREDIAGKPFVGPAGRLLDECLHEAGVDRSLCYVTNAVKHFKFEQRGKRRIHAKPNAGEIQRCAWWLGGELDVLQPNLIVALGATALYSLMGRSIAPAARPGAPTASQGIAREKMPPKPADIQVVVARVDVDVRRFYRFLIHQAPNQAA